MDKKLGKITSVTFGYGGYNDAMMALNLTFEGDGWGTNWSINGGFAPSIVEWSKYCKWTEEDRNKAQSNMVREIDIILKKAKVISIDLLKNIPVEVEFDGNILKSWRILTEVI